MNQSPGFRQKSAPELLEQLTSLQPHHVSLGAKEDLIFEVGQRQVNAPDFGLGDNTCAYMGLKGAFGQVIGEVIDEHAKGRKPLATILEEAYTNPENQILVGGVKNGAAPDYGYIGGLRRWRHAHETAFTVLGSEKDHGLVRHPEWLEADTHGLILNNNPDLAAKLFPNGNFLLHTAEAERISAVLSSGLLENGTRLRQLRNLNPHQYFSNVGQAGISWNYNELFAMPGTPFHIAGFMAAPEKLQSSGNKLFVPLDAAPNEVQSTSEHIDTVEYKQAHAQVMLWQKFYKESSKLIGEFDSGNPQAYVNSNLYKTVRALQKGRYDLDDDIRSQFEFKDGQTVFKPELLDSQISVLAVVLQSLIDGGDGPRRGQPLESIADLTESRVMPAANTALRLLEDEFETAHQQFREICEAAGPDSAVAVEDMVFVCGRRDFERVWKYAIAYSEHAPKAVLLFDDRRVRIPNFVVEKGVGDHAALSEEIRQVIPRLPQTKSWFEILPKPEHDREGKTRHMVGVTATLQARDEALIS